MSREYGSKILCLEWRLPSCKPSVLPQPSFGIDIDPLSNPILLYLKNRFGSFAHRILPRPTSQTQPFQCRRMIDDRIRPTAQRQRTDIQLRVESFDILHSVLELEPLSGQYVSRFSRGVDSGDQCQSDISDVDVPDIFGR